ALLVYILAILKITRRYIQAIGLEVFDKFISLITNIFTMTFFVVAGGAFIFYSLIISNLIVSIFQNMRKKRKKAPVSSPVDVERNFWGLMTKTKAERTSKDDIVFAIISSVTFVFIFNTRLWDISMVSDTIYLVFYLIPLPLVYFGIKRNSRKLLASCVISSFVAFLLSMFHVIRAPFIRYILSIAISSNKYLVHGFELFLNIFSILFLLMTLTRLSIIRNKAKIGVRTYEGFRSSELGFTVLGFLVIYLIYTIFSVLTLPLELQATTRGYEIAISEIDSILFISLFVWIFFLLFQRMFLDYFFYEATGIKRSKLHYPEFCEYWHQFRSNPIRKRIFLGSCIAFLLFSALGWITVLSYVNPKEVRYNTIYSLQKPVYNGTALAPLEIYGGGSITFNIQVMVENGTLAWNLVRIWRYVDGDSYLDTPEWSSSSSCINASTGTVTATFMDLPVLDIGGARFYAINYTITDLPAISGLLFLSRPVFPSFLVQINATWEPSSIPYYLQPYFYINLSAGVFIITYGEIALYLTPGKAKAFRVKNCPYCNGLLDRSYRFCTHCGHPIDH
nr:hypothetical protein [Candidatus Sigynarchaeota archaeon]